MKKRGGGVLDIWSRIIDCSQLDESKKMMIVHIEVDVCESMGANIINTIAEGMSESIVKLTRGRSGLRILTNLCLHP